MRKALVKVTVLLVAGLGLTAGSLRAQPVVTLHGGAAVPVGAFGDIADVGFGGAASLGVMLGDSWLLRGEGGYWRFTKEVSLITTGGGVTIDVEGAVVPLRAGFRKYWGESKRFFTGPNFGIYIPTSDLDAIDPKFGIGPQIGYRFPTGSGTSIDLIVELHTIFIGDSNPRQE